MVLRHLQLSTTHNIPDVLTAVKVVPRDFMTPKSERRLLKARRQPAESLGYVKRLLPAIGVGLNAKQFQAFQRYFHEDLGRLRRSPEAYAIRNAEGLLEAVTKFHKKPGLTRDQAIAIVSSAAGVTNVSGAVTTQEPYYYSSVEMVMRIWTNLHVQITQPIPSSTPIHTTIHWTGGNDTFRDLVSNHFEARKGRTAPKYGPIDQRLSMALLVKAYGYRVSWTGSLADHLNIDSQCPGQIMVYEHKICLWNHLRMAQGGQDAPVLPLPLIEEAIDTLNLLFPFGDPSTKTFLRSERKYLYGLGHCGREIQHNFQNYQYWRKEIEILAEMLSHPPRGRAQFILNKDGTNTLEFWTFWTAIAFGILAIIGVITGVYSAVYAKKAYDVGILQYQLALAQACSALNATDLLPGFCQ